MDIKKFNEVLSSKIAKAKSFESHGDLDVAIDLWIEISDLTLKASKQPDLDFTYRHMLISKAEQIINHVKELKNPKKEVPIVEDIKIEEGIIQIPEINVDVNSEDEKSNNIKDEDFSVDFSAKVNDSNEKEHKIIENSEVNNMPDGIKEIEPLKDFKIITPHDPNYVEKMKKMNKDVDINVYKKPKGEPSKEEEDVGDKRICFACGAILQPKTQICPECGTKLN
ncbi:MAG: hypothetical protein ACFFHV_19460 [Promethearchaeota archaeon]